jgi:hypothetical protein
MTALYALSPWTLLGVTAVVAVVLTCAGRVVVRRRFPRWDFVQHNEVAGFIVAVVGTLFAVTLAFVTAIVWQEYDRSASRAAVEASAATDVWHLALGLPEPLATRTRSRIVEYAHAMVEREWPAMRRGEASESGERILTEALSDVARFHPRDTGEANVQAAVLHGLETMHDARRDRLFDNAAGVSPFQWGILLVGALVVIGFCYLFGMANEGVMLIMLSLLAILIASTMVLIFELDYPFRGDLAITPQAWTGFLQRLTVP